MAVIADAGRQWLMALLLMRLGVAWPSADSLSWAFSFPAGLSNYRKRAGKNSTVDARIICQNNYLAPPWRIRTLCRCPDWWFEGACYWGGSARPRRVRPAARCASAAATHAGQPRARRTGPPAAPAAPAARPPAAPAARRTGSPVVLNSSVRGAEQQRSPR